MEEKTRALGYICPKCLKPVYGERTEFALLSGMVGLVCECGESELSGHYDGRRFRLTVPCGLCGEEHRGEVPVEAILSEGGSDPAGVGLACPDRQGFCCYIGSPAQVRAGLASLEETVEKNREKGEETFVNDVVMYEVLSELKDIMARDGVACTCGHRGCSLRVHGGGVDLICPACGGRLRIPAATDEDLDRLCCQATLTIRGERS